MTRLRACGAAYECDAWATPPRVPSSRRMSDDTEYRLKRLSEMVKRVHKTHSIRMSNELYMQHTPGWDGETPSAVSRPSSPEQSTSSSRPGSAAQPRKYDEHTVHKWMKRAVNLLARKEGGRMPPPRLLRPLPTHWEL